MAFIFILAFCLLGMLFILFMKNPIIKMVGDDNVLVNHLKNAKWFQNHWRSGIFLFCLNAVLFFSTIFLLYGFMHFLIPYIHFLVMAMAAILSLYLWIGIGKAWRGTKRNRLKMGALGSSFFILMSLFFLYKLVTIKPLYPGEDLFMREIGLDLAIVVTTVAFISCFLFTGVSHKKER